MCNSLIPVLHGKIARAMTLVYGLVWIRQMRMVEGERYGGVCFGFEEYMLIVFG